MKPLCTECFHEETNKQKSNGCQFIKTLDEIAVVVVLIRTLGVKYLDNYFKLPKYNLIRTLGVSI